MEPEQVRRVVHTTLALVTRISRRTRTPADDLLMSIVQANEARLAEAVAAVLAAGDGPPTDEQLSAALAQVGIKA